MSTATAAVLGLVAVIATMVVPTRSNAVSHGLHVGLNPGQVRISQNGNYLGGGTLVDSQWVLTVAHLFNRPDTPGIYSLRFGELTSGSDTTQLRFVDEIVTHPSGADLAMVHFANPITSGTVVPTLSTQAPLSYSDINLYSWGASGSVLERGPGVAIDPTATVNAAWLRDYFSGFASAFPQANPPPLVVNYDGASGDGDSGAGVYVGGGTLAGVHVGTGPYRWTNSSGNQYGDEFYAGYEQPVWSYADWIRRTINGEGTSGHDELKRRKLAEVSSSDTPTMTAPPSMAICDPGDPNCTTPAPVWEPAQLTATTQQKNVVTTTCWDQQGSSCTMQTTFTAGATAQLSLDSISTTSSRDIEAWCRIPATGNSSQSSVLFSFINDDKADGPLGTGWWIASQNNVTSNGTALDLTQLSTCPS